MRILIDTDVLLDVALNRPDFVAASQGVLRWAEAEPGQAAVAWHSLSNVAYLTESPRDFLRQLLEFVEVAPVGTRAARHAIELPMADLEDAFQAAAAMAFGAAVIVTRNVEDYRRSPVRAVAPAVFLKRLGQ